MVITSPGPSASHQARVVSGIVRSTHALACVLQLLHLAMLLWARDTYYRNRTVLLACTKLLSVVSAAAGGTFRPGDLDRALLLSQQATAAFLPTGRPVEVHWRLALRSLLLRSGGCSTQQVLISCEPERMIADDDHLNDLGNCLNTCTLSLCSQVSMVGPLLCLGLYLVVAHTVQACNVDVDCIPMSSSPIAC